METSENIDCEINVVQDVCMNHDNENRNDMEDDFNQGNPYKRLVVKAVLQAMTIVDNSGCSIKTFEDILSYGRTMLFTNLDPEIDEDILASLWPKSWSEVQSLLKEEGFTDPKEYYICICRAEKSFTRNGKTTKKYLYSRKWGIMESKNELCPNCGKCGYIKYYYLGLHEKLKNWFRNLNMCRKMLSHWQEREHWLKRNTSWPLKKEVWDGEIWLEVQWFWDPDQLWTVPTRCGECLTVISSDLINSSPKDIDGLSLLECPECFNKFSHKAEVARGSPLNLALIGHWDGWQPFSTSGRSCGSLEVSILNMFKTDRSHIDEVYVIGFVPCTTVPKGVPEAYDPFIQPLINDLCDGFIHGFEVPYPSNAITVPDYEAHEIETVRVMLLCWAADHPGQCEFGKYLNQGKCACRRCKMVGQQSLQSTHYYYGDNRFHARHPWEKRDVTAEESTFYDLDNENRVSVRKKLSSQEGFTGTPIFHQYLYPLYKFDCLYHMVYDIFHTLPLNICKNQLSRLLRLELLDAVYVDEQIAQFPWNTEFKQGRIPTSIGKEHKGLGHWKAESFQKFFFPMLGCIVEDKIPDPKELEIISLVSYLTELHFYSGRNGWTDSMIQLHERLAQTLIIRIEETQGLEMCTISVHNLTHAHEDLINFAASDNYWCAVFERAVKKYVGRSHNCKGLEMTFAKAECRRESLKSLEQAHGDLPIEEKDDKIEGIVKSEDEARKICTASECEGLLIGSRKPQLQVIELTDNECSRINSILSLPQSVQSASRIASTSGKCFLSNVGFNGLVLSSNDNIIASLEDGECIVQIKRFLLIRYGLDNNHSVLIEGFIKPFNKSSEGEIDVNVWSGFPKVKLQPNDNSVIFSHQSVQRKVMLYKHAQTNLQTVVDYDRQLKDVPRLLVPVYPEKDDMLFIQGEKQGDIWYGRVSSVDLSNKAVEVYFYVEKQQHPNRFVRESFSRQARNTVVFDSIIGIANGHWISGNIWQKSV
ncbi:uncharacterized protein LOC125568272 [Nematostella vectensis]|uniref:uncharacterized protein LOC125568272 n=1 Tax=Nematostella vectensis TaxID=45351 RepID=UPI0020775373|nr:uncharacterized protein LOC125568272 [Nematostella vectensis]